MPPPPKKSDWKLVNGKFTKVPIKPCGPPPKKENGFPNLPCGQFVKIVPEADDAGTFMIVTTRLGNAVGTRLDRGRGNYPECATRSLTRFEAEAAFKKWETFVNIQQQKK